MIPDSIAVKLKGNEFPSNFEQLEKEIHSAKSKGYNVPEMKYEDGIYTKGQAEKELGKFGVCKTKLFHELFSTYRFFPIGNGEEIHNVSEMANDPEGFLQLSSPEGEGSYFYQISTDAIFDVSWGEEKLLSAGKLEPTWLSFKEFMGWYYNA